MASHIYRSFNLQCSWQFGSGVVCTRSATTLNISTQRINVTMESHILAYPIKYERQPESLTTNACQTRAYRFIATSTQWKFSPIFLSFVFLYTQLIASNFSRFHQVSQLCSFSILRNSIHLFPSYIWNVLPSCWPCSYFALNLRRQNCVSQEKWESWSSINKLLFWRFGNSRQLQATYWPKLSCNFQLCNISNGSFEAKTSLVSPTSTHTRAEAAGY